MAFRARKFSELSRNGPLVDLKFCLSFPSRLALEIQEVKFGNTHPSVASALNDLAVVLCLQVNKTF